MALCCKRLVITINTAPITPSGKIYFATSSREGMLANAEERTGEIVRRIKPTAPKKTDEN